MYYVNPQIKDLVRVFPGENRGSFLRLDMNENPEGLPLAIVAELKEIITPEFLATYPEREDLLQMLSEHHGLKQECFCITDGSEMAIKYIYEAFVKPGSKVVTVKPSFEMYGVYCNMYGAKHVAIDIDKDFRIDVEWLISSIDEETSLVVLLNPNNPVGEPYGRSDVLKIVNKAKECGTRVIVDEAYHYFYDSTYVDLVTAYDNVIVLRTFSKLFSISACRVGYAISNIETATILNKVRPTFDTNYIALKFAALLLRNVKLREQLILTEREGREYLLEQLKANDYIVYQNGGNYVFVKPRLTPELVAEKLHEKNILVKTYSYELLREYLRVTTGSKKCMEKFCTVFLECDKETLRK